MHCCICDFCETVPAARNYVTDFVHHGNKVIYHEKLKDFYCFECIEQIGIWRRSYQDDAAKFIAESEMLLDKETEDIEPKEFCTERANHHLAEDTLALSEV